MSSSVEKTSHIPITVFTGFLGAGKTSIILSLLPKLPKDYRVVLLKNEFGNVEVDSQLAKQSSLAAVSEILNGCIGSAFPATLAFQIRELERETERDLRLDAIVTVIDAENFTGYEDTSPTAKMQASYTDVILINKWEHISDRALDILIDHLNTLNDTTPKVRCEGRAGVDPDLIFGLDSKLFLAEAEHPSENHHDEVETATIYRGAKPPHPAGHIHTHGDSCTCSAAAALTGASDMPPVDEASDVISEETLTAALGGLSKETIWRVKGFVRTAEGVHILNWAFGRFDLSACSADGLRDGGSVLFTVMGERGEVKRVARRFAEKTGASVA
ncbi:hypothetical protein EVJ58_g6402 [Rhodofomes roseus]|uniref:CobW/HypB/UreG nucleotide-binding domain-containing protein n=1 Tax=Rhodofomes roseus TaxID=34475 RepID=A0A4Y9Y8U2_9APHY|nr:hypothetical protein EVJ58_g6402 [Rhodofomes roseus]